MSIADALAEPSPPRAVPSPTAPLVRDLGRTGYCETLERMRAFTRSRGVDTPDEIWLTEHPPVYTLGLAASRSHVREPGDIPVVASDRGGQVTYHGPGQLVAYVLVDLGRRGLKVGEMVRALESALIDTLGEFGIAGHRRAGMPGVYVAGAKIASLGLKVSRGRSYHGVSLNGEVDLEPFRRIDPCGHAGLAVTRAADLAPDWDAGRAGATLAARIIAQLARPCAPGDSTGRKH